MKIYEINDISLLESSIPEDQWDGQAVPDGKWSAQAYDIDKIVYYDQDTPHRVYKSLVSNNEAVPGTDASAWSDKGATDRWKAFDNKFTTQSNFGSSGYFELSADYLNGIGLLGLDLTALRLTHYLNMQLLDDFSADVFLAGDGCSYNSGAQQYEFDGSQTDVSELYQVISAMLRGTSYLVRFEIANYVAGSISPMAGDITGDAVSANGEHWQIITIDPNTDAVDSSNGLVASSDFQGDVTSLTMQRVTKFEDIDMRIMRASSYYRYCFTRYRYKKKVTWDFPRYSSATVMVEMSKSAGDALVGVCMPGEFTYVGGMLKDVVVEPVSNSDIDEDDQGETEFITRQGTVDCKMRVRFLNEDLEQVQDLLSSTDGRLAIFDGNHPDTYMSSVIQFGYYQSAQVTIRETRYSILSITIKGVL